MKLIRFGEAGQEKPGIQFWRDWQQVGQALYRCLLPGIPAGAFEAIVPSALSHRCQRMMPYNLLQM